MRGRGTIAPPGLERGGLARRGPGGAPAAIPVETPHPVDGGAQPATASIQGDDLVVRTGRWDRLRIDLGYAGFLLYIGVITTYAVALGDVAIALALVGVFLGRHGVRFPRPLILFALFLGWTALGWTQTLYPEVVGEELETLAKLGIILFVGMNVLRTRAQIRFFIIFWLGCFALYPLRGTYFNYFGAGYTTFGRAIWNYIYANPNDLAALALLQLSMVVGVLVTEREGWFRRAAFVGVFMVTLLIFLTGSRGGILALAVFGFLALSGSRKRLRAVLLGVVVLMVVAIFAPSNTWDRLSGLRGASVSNLAQVDEEGSAEQRWQIWQTAFQIIPDHLFTGVGWGAYPQANMAYAPMTGGGEFQLGARDTHSTYLNVLAETGVPGFVLFMTLVFGTLLHVRRIRRRHATALPKTALQLYYLELGLIAFMTSGIFGSYSRLSFLYLHLLLMWVFAEVMEREARQVEAQPASRGRRVGVR